MQPLFWIVAAPLAVAAVVPIRRSAAVRRASLRRFARRVGLPAPDDLRPRLEGLLAVRNLSVDLGGIAGFALVGAWAALADPPILAGPLWPLALLAGGFAGSAVGAGTTAVRQAVARPAGDQPRMARPVAATMSDYVSPLELHGGRLAALVPVSIVLVAGAVGVLPGAEALHAALTPGVLAVALLSLAALAGTEAASRRLLDQPQAAGSRIELAWSDALRARVLRDLVTVPIHVGTYATLGVLVSLDDAVRDELGRVVVQGLGLLLMIAVLCAGLTSLLTRPQQHFRRTLWSGLEADAAGGGGSR